MTRFNIFNQIHKGLRLVMFETASHIQQTDFSSKALSYSAIERLQQTLAYFDTHAEHENGFIFPLIEKVEPVLAKQFTGEHDTDEQLAQHLRKLITGWDIAPDGAATIKAGLDIMYTFISFVAFNLDHMNKEERLLNEVLWNNYTDEEIAGVEHAIISSIPPDLLFEESRFMMRAINDRELVGWLSAVKLNAPPPVYDAFVNMMEQEIDATRRIAIVQELATV